MKKPYFLSRGPQLRDRPHWAARIENRINLSVGAFLHLLGFPVRIQPFHGYGSTTRIRVLAKFLYGPPGSSADYYSRPLHDMRGVALRGFRSFTSQVAIHRHATIEVAGKRFTVKADRTGIIDTYVNVELPPGLHEVKISTGLDDAVFAPITVFDPDQPLAVVSDVDDTVVVTMLPRPLLAAWNAFIVHQSARRVVPGMPALYETIRQNYPNAPFIYLSTGAWNVYPVLRRFLYRNGYPTGPMLLTDWGPTNTGFFRSGRQHKESQLRELAREFPEVNWLLIGDDGQHDPEIYARFAREHSDQVEAVAIRQLSASEQVFAHFSTTPMPIAEGDPGSEKPTYQVSAPDGFGLINRLREIGVLN